MKTILSICAVSVMIAVNVSAKDEAHICEEDQGGTWVLNEGTKKWQCDGIDEEKVKNMEALKRIPKYEEAYLKEFEKLKKSTKPIKSTWIQPKNKQTPCKVYATYQVENPYTDDSYTLFWDGDCKDGYAHGLGREIEKANLIDSWTICIHEKGKFKGHGIQNDILKSMLIEGELKYTTPIYGVVRHVDEGNGNIPVIYRFGKFDLSNKEPSLWMETSPFINNSFGLNKAYPNFRYEYLNHADNELINQEFEFSIYNDKNIRHGWYIGKEKEKDVVYAEYVNGEWSIVNLPQMYHDKADNIIYEIYAAKDKALEAQAKAQLVKKQYVKKICKDSIKVDFMDNDEYKEICEDKYEKELSAKIETQYKQLEEQKPILLQKMKEEQEKQRQDEEKAQGQSEE